ncbi:hypothetical protein HUJ04_006622 [Dendroctonus ponderosae]|nr:hypothetical protein HUJ04_006622 [Dendroctonus ponderosae]
MFNLVSKVAAGPLKGEFGTLLKALPVMVNNVQPGRNYAEHVIPDRLKDMPDNPNPRFFDMVEYFFHKACVLVEDKLVEDLAKVKGSKLTLEQRKAKVRGILTHMEHCDHIIEVAFPIKRDNGEYEVIKGYRAQHSTHRLPCKGENRKVLMTHEISSVANEYQSTMESRKDLKDRVTAAYQQIHRREIQIATIPYFRESVLIDREHNA